MGISDSPPQQRPRERLMREGARALSDEDLIDIDTDGGVSARRSRIRDDSAERCR